MTPPPSGTAEGEATGGLDTFARAVGPRAGTEGDRLAQPEPPGRRRIPGLDGLRAISIILVMMSHTAESATFPRWLEAPRIWDGSLGVRIFFGISGFLITGVMLDDETRSGRIRLGAFYRRRARRILPPVVAYLCAVAIVSALMPVPLVSAHDLLVAFGFVRNLVDGPVITMHLWSLAVEEQFYLIWPLVLVLAPRRARLGIVTALIVLKPFWGHFLYARFGLSSMLRLDMCADGLACGALVTLLQGAPSKPLAAVISRPAVAVALGLACLAAAQFLRSTGHGGYVFREYALDAGIAAMLCGAIGARPGDLLAFPALGALGRISYSLYLWQQPFTVPRSWPTPMWFANFPVGLVLALLAGYLAERFIERPAMTLGRAPSTT
jgi:peptidoglycan/LPS O-acetylase OafA/YrhL